MLPFRHRYKSYNATERFKCYSDSTTPKMNLEFYLFDQSFNELVYVLFFFTVCFVAFYQNPEQLYIIRDERICD